MPLADLIESEMRAIVANWEAFAATRLPAAQRTHSRCVLSQGTAGTPVHVTRAEAHVAFDVRNRGPAVTPRSFVAQLRSWSSVRTLLWREKAGRRLHDSR